MNLSLHPTAEHHFQYCLSGSQLQHPAPHLQTLWLLTGKHKLFVLNPFHSPQANGISLELRLGRNDNKTGSDNKPFALAQSHHLSHHTSLRPILLPYFSPSLSLSHQLQPNPASNLLTSHPFPLLEMFDAKCVAP
jgi:hypothetical protein